MKLAILAAALVAAAPPPSADVLQSIEACAATQAAAGAFSGVVLVEIDGAPALLRSYGMADPGGGRANRADTPFDLGSATKMFTGVAIGQLVEAGKLSFDDPVSRHLSDAPPAIGRITLGQLLSHRGGTGNYLLPKNRARIAAARTARDLMPLVIEEGVRSEPGGAWAYSNSGFVVLGAVIEQVSGRAYVDYVRDSILRKAGMKDTVLTAPPASAARRLSRDGAIPEDGTWASPAGGGYSTAPDLARFVKALRDGVLVSPAVRAQLWGAQASVGPMGSYGYGFGVENGVVGHNGGAPGINTETWWTIGPGWTFVVLSNLDVPAATVVSQAGRLMLSGRAAPDRACAEVKERAGRQPPPGTRVLVRP
jgi:CubicO group peptidase (beta-lactamase class C family)